MSLARLRERIRERCAVIGVIGLGYVGLPVACSFAQAGFWVVGVDLKAERVETINAGRCPIGGREPGLAELLARVVSSGRLRATTDYGPLGDAEVISINVETPVADDHSPDCTALKSACRSLGHVLKDGALVIVESTVAPGTVDRVVRPLLEEVTGKRADEDFYLGACPERVMPGKLLANLRSMSRVCGGSTPEAAATMVALYCHVVDADLDPADCVTAELVKTTENAYRDVQIAFANEVALICEANAADVWRVRELVNKSPSRQMHLPGAGVGGHCIPKDPWLLAQSAGSQPARLIPAARAVNDGMPLHMADMVVQALDEVHVPVAGAKAAILGYAYLEDSDDARNTPTETLARRLRELGAEVVIHDPHVQPYATSLQAVVRGADCLVLMVRHREYLELDWDQVRCAMRMPVMVDGRNMLSSTSGWIYHGVGKAADGDRRDG